MVTVLVVIAVMPTAEHDRGSYRHEALLYAGIDEFTTRVGAFVRDGLDADEVVLVVVTAEKIARLRDLLGGDAARVHFRDMLEVGQNPARIVQAWRDLIARHVPDGATARGVGEPVWPERTASELAECHTHEASLNVAFDDSLRFWLICPYDTAALDPTVIGDALRTHPYVRQRWTARPSPRYRAPRRWRPAALPDLGAPLQQHRFDASRMYAIRRVVADHAAALGFSTERAEDAILAVNEVMTNSVRYGGACGTVALWHQGRTLVCEVHDRGRIEPVLAGRIRPPHAQAGGHGLWIANQCCDLVQIRCDPSGTTVRLFISRH
ncbi:MAG: hypothetical protein JWL83_2449 [Actinomycetia bacterium]|nr:hypothetical protein [Actinomycetes bacterium]